MSNDIKSYKIDDGTTSFLYDTGGAGFSYTPSYNELVDVLKPQSTQFLVDMGISTFVATKISELETSILTDKTNALWVEIANIQSTATIASAVAENASNTVTALGIRVSALEEAILANYTEFIAFKDAANAAITKNATDISLLTTTTTNLNNSLLLLESNTDARLKVVENRSLKNEVDIEALQAHDTIIYSKIAANTALINSNKVELDAEDARINLRIDAIGGDELKTRITTLEDLTSPWESFFALGGFKNRATIETELSMLQTLTTALDTRVGDAESNIISLADRTTALEIFNGVHSANIEKIDTIALLAATNSASIETLTRNIGVMENGYLPTTNVTHNVTEALNFKYDGVTKYNAGRLFSVTESTPLSEMISPITLRINDVESDMETLKTELAADSSSVAGLNTRVETLEENTKDLPLLRNEITANSNAVASHLGQLSNLTIYSASS
ncbi:MAG: hypothetical protein ATN33_01095 [Epulopiscium sp. Nele67-Bin001]|nr:MAG: hypothetical protein ATN33_01095 [Epulopiscium sp. Nele67-Bin001]